MGGGMRLGTNSSCNRQKFIAPELPCDYRFRVLLYVLTRRIAQSTFIMKNLLMLAVIAAALLVCQGQGIAAEPETAKTPSGGQAKADLQVLIGKVQAKLTGAKKTEQDLADELKEFDALLAKYKDQKTDEVA